ncbi:immunoglobulin I-set domain-containing protein [Loa loa]|uniref:Immunoglobulin I-set domain-containing protein n=1 Tax=Loa loa TaxID=7209 RepID=A0A1S0TZY0_LOALO|nr:immunoglobulin I-set domain-containing protein [Loa loa]EFO22181.2 immunoglobulin I-set domain-containing protein [Loa loa]
MGQWFYEKNWTLLVYMTMFLLFTRVICLERCPEECHCLDTHIDCSRRGLTDVPYSLPSWATTLELQGNYIEKILPIAFVGLGSLISLDLSENQIGGFSRLVFAHTPQLETLLLRKNRLNSIPLGIESLANLRKLDLKANNISQVTTIDVSRIAKIDVVDLSRNVIRDFPRLHMLQAANAKITKLDLSNNLLTTLRSDTFMALQSLRILRLSRNKIETIEKSAFQGLFALRFLDLSRNRLAVLHALTFSPLTSLQNLSLARNFLGTLEDGTFWGLEQLQRLNIAENQLKAVTGGWLYGMHSLIALDLSSNDVAWIDSSAWSLCSTLQWLDLSSNRLRMLPSLLFKKLSRLEYLSLADNQIDTIHRNAMHDLDKLNYLDLSGNGLAMCVEDESVLANTSLPALRTLKFTSNRVRTIPAHAFENFPALQNLDLTDNPIASVQNGAFESLHLRRLFINTSSLVCDCELKWFSHWLFLSKLDRKTITMLCSYPVALRGIDVAVIDDTNLTCVDDSPRPRLLNHPNALVKALLGNSIKLNCTGYGAAPLDIKWKVIRDGRFRLLSHDATTVFVYNHSSATNSTVTGLAMEYLFSELQLNDIGFSDQAEYQCIVRNHYGSAYSLKVKLMVLQKPRIDYSPSNVSIIRGGSARLRCAAQGVPTPIIKWMKDGGDSFPAAVERRLHVKANDDNLYVVNVSLADTGIYTCRVSNEAGHVESSAHVLVYDNKVWPQLEDRKVHSGATVIFNCSINEQFRVSVQWLRDGRLIDPSTAPSRLAFKAGNQLLVLSEARASDSGVYGCEFKVGSEVLSRVSSTLVVEIGAEEDWNKRREHIDKISTDKSLQYSVAICTITLIILAAGMCSVIFFMGKRKKARQYSSVKSDSATTTIEKQPTSEKDSAVLTETTQVYVVV